MQKGIELFKLHRNFRPDEDDITITLLTLQWAKQARVNAITAESMDAQRTFSHYTAFIPSLLELARKHAGEAEELVKVADALVRKEYARYTGAEE